MKRKSVQNNIENKININGSTWSSTPTMNFEKEGVGVDDHIDPFKDKGITLIALIITIILMLILAGVVISLTLGENGLFSTAKYAVTKTEEETAREKLELALADLQTQKNVNIDYDESVDIDKYLTDKEMIVAGDIVIVNGWKFTIDKSVPKIEESLGKGEESKKITITPNVENAGDYTKATIKVEVAYDEVITQIKIDGQEEEIPEKQEGKYTIEKEVTTNGKHTIYVKDENDEYKTEIVNVTEISEDLEIENVEQLVWFRNRVNKGATYKEKTITVVKDLDLGDVCGTNANGISWEPIGKTSEKPFCGTFDGNNHTINRLYIDSTEANQGLFGTLENATIKNITIDNSYIRGTNFIGTIAGRGNGATIENVHTTSNVTVMATTPNIAGCYVGGILGETSGGVSVLKSSNAATVYGNGNYIGGIVGVLNGTINQCYNTGSIQDNGRHQDVGGIIGVHYSAGVDKVLNCYNTGTINGYEYVGGIAGEVHPNSKTSLVITNCYNIGTVTGTRYTSEIIGYIRDSRGEVTNCYIKSQEITASKLGEYYAEDKEKINKGYPILTWQVKK